MLETTIIKKSIRKNSKNISLRINHKGEIIITSPYPLSAKKYQQIIKNNQTWIEGHLIQHLNSQNNCFPENIKLTALDKTWHIEYQKTPSKPKLMSLNENSFIIYGNYTKIEVVQLLKRWLTQQAKQSLYPWLQQVSHEITLPYNSVSIGHHRAQWGSCNGEKHISLNAKLLFLPSILVRHVMIHELVHTIHFNHSINFWHCVARYDAHWKENKKILKTADNYLPDWI
tara:strand:+ start:1814 stop:2497 length:684 start_codon:yes stop_codon:yes gene_type:complete